MRAVNDIAFVTFIRSIVRLVRSYAHHTTELPSTNAQRTNEKERTQEEGMEKKVYTQRDSERVREKAKHTKTNDEKTVPRAKQ